MKIRLTHYTLDRNGNLTLLSINEILIRKLNLNESFAMSLIQDLEPET
jgi:hypothetical protein